MVGSAVDTRAFCGANEAALAETDARVQEVEAFLEEVRAARHPDAPSRLCAILVIPWPKYRFRERRREYGETEHEPMPLPGSLEPFCYFVERTSRSRYLLADERWVDKLVEEWEELEEDLRIEIATWYWNGVPRAGAPITVLVEGEIRIDGVCTDPAPLKILYREPAPMPVFRTMPAARSQQLKRERA